MGIVNVTPDSFSDRGLFAGTDAAVAHALQLVEQGADLLDIGGESSRPGAVPVPLDEEMQRVLPVVQRLSGAVSVPISIDTCKAAVAHACLAAGAHIINDITALNGDPAMAEVARTTGAGVILPNQGIAAEQLALDPGIGFGKTTEHNLELLARLGEFQRFGRPVCLGASRKGGIGKVLKRPVEQRLAGSLAVVLYAMSRSAAQVVRVHDVAETRDVVVMWEALEGMKKGPELGETTGAAL